MSLVRIFRTISLITVGPQMKNFNLNAAYVVKCAPQYIVEQSKRKIRELNRTFIALATRRSVVVS